MTGMPDRSDESAPPVVVDADQALPGPLGREERGLGREVVVHVGVEVEVVLREVGEQGDVVDHPVDPVLGQGVARHLHDAAVEPRSAITASTACSSGASGVVRTLPTPLVADPGLHGADQPRVAAHRRQRGVHEVGGGRFAVGAGDADQAQGEPLGAETRGRQAPSTARGCSTTTAGRATPAAAIRRRPSRSVSTATAPAAAAWPAKSAPWAARRAGRRRGRPGARRVSRGSPR